MGRAREKDLRRKISRAKHASGAADWFQSFPLECTRHGIERGTSRDEYNLRKGYHTGGTISTTNSTGGRLSGVSRSEEVRASKGLDAVDLDDKLFRPSRLLFPKKRRPRKS